MTELTLIDLRAQYDQVQKFVDGMTESDTLEWMQNYGTIRKITNPYDSKAYSFRSKAGLVSGFRFDDNGRIIILHEDRDRR